MPMALPFLPMIMGAAGAGLSALGGGGTKNTSTNNSSTTYTEDPAAKDFRSSLYGPYANLLNSAQKPMYGDAEAAGFTNKLNQNTNANFNTLASQIASRTGSVNSGAMFSGAQNILRDRAGAQTQYNMQVPLLNKQNQLTNTSNILGLGMNFAGRAPVNSTTSGTSTGSNSSNQGFGSNFANALGPMLGGGASGTGAFGGLAGLLGKIFGGGGAMTEDSGTFV